MKPGDAIAAHDYSIDGEIWPWGEITKDDVTAESLLPFYRVALSQAGWLGYTK
jgi:hypothetical protein